MQRNKALRRAAGRILVSGLLLGAAGCASDGGGAERERVSGQYAFWPVPPEDPHVQFLQSFNSAEDLTPGARSGLGALVFGEDEIDESAINKPYGIAMHEGRIYVCDIRRNGVVVFDLEKKEMRLVGVTGFNALANPVDVAVADDGMIYVADNERNAVLVYGADERFSRVYGHDDLRPVGLAVHGDRLYVCNLDAQQVEVYDRHTGELTGTIGEVGEGDGQFRVPLGIDTDAEGNVYVVDMMRGRLQKFSPEGEFIGAVGAIGDFAGGFARPKQVAVDRDGIVYVVDAAFNNVQMFDSQFRLLMHFGAAGEFSGAMNLPAGICVSEEAVKYFADRLHPGFGAERIILVTNQFGRDKVSAYALGERRAGWSVADLTASAADVSTGTGTGEASRLQIPEDAAEPMGEEQPAEQEQPAGEPEGPGGPAQPSRQEQPGS